MPILGQALVGIQGRGVSESYNRILSSSRPKILYFSKTLKMSWTPWTTWKRKTPESNKSVRRDEHDRHKRSVAIIQCITERLLPFNNVPVRCL
jgi:hypothetical protein